MSPDEPRDQQEREHDTRENGELVLVFVHPLTFDGVIAIPGIDLDFDRVGFDSVNGSRTDLGQHGLSYALARAEAQCGNIHPRMPE